MRLGGETPRFVGAQILLDKTGRLTELPIIKCIPETGDPTIQQLLESRIEELTHEEDYGYVVDGLEGAIQEAREFISSSDR